MRKLENFVNEFAEIATLGFGLNSRKNDDGDDYIDYLG